MTPNPRVVFEQLFADIAPRRNGAKLPNSILDAVSPDVARLNRVLPAGDRSVLDGWLDEIRAVERRIEEIEKQNAAAPDRELPSAPLGVPDSWERHVKLMFDLQVLAFRSEVTRVSAFKMSRDTSNRIFPESGVKIPFHTLSHHSEREDLIAEFALLNRYHVGFVAYFLNRLKETPDGDGNLLDHSLVLYGSPMGDSNTHNHRRLPLFLAGHAAGRLQGNLHRVCPPETPLANCLLTVLHKLGVDLPAIGDSTGEISI